MSNQVSGFVAITLLVACAGRPAPPVASSYPGPERAIMTEDAPVPSLALEAAPVKATPLPVGACGPKGEMDCLIRSIIAARDRLPGAKHGGVTRTLSEAVAMARDANLRDRWDKALGPFSEDAPGASSLYAEDAVLDLVERAGWDGLIARAREAKAPFNMGRPEAMATALAHADTPATRARVIDAMFELARTKQTRGGMGDDFEKGDFGHVLAEAAMKACDLKTFDRAVALTPAPDNLRYALWRARVTGGAGRLAPRIEKETSTEDSTAVLQAIDGLAPLLAHGYCKA